MNKSGFRHLLKASFILLAVLVFSANSCVGAEPVKRPNIIMFLVDDMGWQDTSVPFWTKKTPFNERYHTPAMERLAREGMIFTQAYASCVCSPTRVSLMSGMKSLGDIMDWLDRNGLAENTVILFMSDNGGFSLRPRAGELHTHNKPLNSGKGSAYEGGIREPMIVRWPGKVQPGTRCSDYLIIEDFFPTILEIAGIKKYATVQHVDGKSFIPMLLQTGNSSKGRDLYWHFPNNWGPTGPGIGAASTIRSDDWKLVYFYEDGHFELYNIKIDIGELNNIAGQQPAKVKEMAVNLGKYLRGVKAQRPSYKSTGRPVPWPDEVL